MAQVCNDCRVGESDLWAVDIDFVDAGEVVVDIRDGREGELEVLVGGELDESDVEPKVLPVFVVIVVRVIVLDFHPDVVVSRILEDEQAWIEI